MREIIESALPFLIGVALFLAYLAYAMSERFFSSLIKSQPNALDRFRRELGLAQYGPIAPAKFRYLNARQFASLQDQDLRRKGSQAYLALAVYTASFVALLVVALVWGAQHGP
jgi:hypothetical protein